MAAEEEAAVAEAVVMAAVVREANVKNAAISPMALNLSETTRRIFVNLSQSFVLDISAQDSQIFLLNIIFCTNVNA